MQPMRGGSRNLTTNYTLEIRNDSVFSYLPYFGVAYNAPYGGGKSLIFNASITAYTTRALKKGKIQIDFKTRSDEDNYEYRLTIFPDGSNQYPCATHEQTVHLVHRRDGYRKVIIFPL